MSLLEADHSKAVTLCLDWRHFFSCSPAVLGHISERVPFLVSFPINAQQILSEVSSLGFLLLWIRWLGVAVQSCGAILMLTTQSQQRPHRLGAQSLTSDTKHKVGTPQAPCTSDQLTTNYSFIMKDTNRTS